MICEMKTEKFVDWIITVNIVHYQGFYLALPVV